MQVQDLIGGNCFILTHSTVTDCFLNRPYFETTIPFLGFFIEFQSNSLIYHKEYTKRQQIIYALIKYLHDEEGLGYLSIEEIRNQHFPAKISKLEGNYYTFD